MQQLSNEELLARLRHWENKQKPKRLQEQTTKMNYPALREKWRSNARELYEVDRHG